MDDYPQALDYLRRYVGDDRAEFRDGQWEAIQTVLQGGRIAVIKRTGWGKSAVYFIAAKLLRDRGEGMALLISPLLSLMRNQIASAARMGVNAVTINCTNVGQWDQVNAQIAENRADLLLISPERLGQEEFFAVLMKLIDRRIALLVVDEAHCISDWGHDFRPDYLRIRQIIRQLPPGLPVLATTATANARVETDLRSQLGPNLRIDRGEMIRLSLKLQNFHIPDLFERMAWLVGVVKRIDGTGIVYVLTKRHAEYLAEWLQANGIDAYAYHSDSGNEPGSRSREELENMLLNNELKVLVATVALGMGFDKPDLAFVIHFHRPASVVHYYQQVGRAGRNLASAFGLLVEGAEDKQICDSFIDGAYPEAADVDAFLEQLRKSAAGLSLMQLYRRLNLKRSQVDQIVKMLEYEDPPPIVYANGTYRLTGTVWTYPAEKIEQLKALRQREQQVMHDYIRTSECLMAFLARELGDNVTAAKKCGQCVNCRGQALIDYHPAPEEVRRAEDFLTRRPIELAPRKRLPAKDLLKSTAGIGYMLGKSGQLLEPGRAMSYYGFGTLGTLVRQGRETGRWDDRLLAGTVQFLREKWFVGVPLPFAWLTGVPSGKHPEFGNDFLPRLAAALGVSYAPALTSTGHKVQPQQTCRNSFAQLANLDGEYQVVPNRIPPGAALLVDDFADSRWTLALTGALLRKAGVPAVYPLALAQYDAYHVE